MKHFKEQFTKYTLPLVALVGLGVVMPLLDVFGNSPQFFVAKDHRPWEVFLLGLILALLPVLLVAGIESLAFAIHPKFGQIVHLVLVAGLGLMLSLAVLRKLPVEMDWLIWLTGALAALLLLLAEHYWRPFRIGLRFLLICPLVAFIIFITISPSADIIWKGEARAATLPGIGNPAPVVILFFDEFPTASLLTDENTINAERFPNFASLADQSYWFRNNTSLYPWTAASITAALTGNKQVEGRAFDSFHYPQNLFTLLGSSYEMQVYEQITNLCPKTLCNPPFSSEGDDWVSGTAGSRLYSSFIDTGVVYAHTVFPPGIRTYLPSIRHSMGGFLGQDVVNTQNREGQTRAGKTTLAQIAIFKHLIESIRPTSKPNLYFMHIVFPHYPWELTPSGYTYTSKTYEFDDLESIPGLKEERDYWGKDTFLVRQGFQRHLMQIGYLDHLLGELFDRMQAAGTWDRSLFVVAADHGVSFLPNQTRRGSTRKNMDEIYRVPFFMKIPGQEQGVVRDDVVTLLDLMPTLVDELEIEIDWTFDGRSLLSDSQPPLGRPFVENPGDHVPPSLDGLLDVTRRNTALFNQVDDGWLGVAAVGEYGNLVGHPASELGSNWLRNFNWTIDQSSDFEQVDFSSGYVPILLTGRLSVPAGMSAPGEVLIAVNNVIAGVGGGFVCQQTECQFSALLTEELIHEGRNSITAFMSSVPSQPLSSKTLALP